MADMDKGLLRWSYCLTKIQDGESTDSVTIETLFMKNKIFAGYTVLTCLLTGCASITGDTMQTVRIETRLADGSEVKDAECELFNEYGSFRVKTPGNALIRRSSTDLNVQCQKEQFPAASAKAVSRANAGMFGNIIFGGGIGAVIDHNKGTAYTYPNWMQLTFGKILTFDRSDDKDGQPSLGREPAATIQQANAESPSQN